MVRVIALLMFCGVLAACSMENPAPGAAGSAPARPEASGGNTPAAQLTTEGAALFKQFCTQCHGPQGNGRGSRSGPSLQSPQLKYGRSPEEISRSIRDGRPGGMPAFAHVVNPRQLEALAAYVMGLKP